MDIYKRYWKKDTSSHSLVTIGRIMTLVFVVLGCLIAPQLGADRFKGIFNFIQEFQGFISPGILAAFVFGIVFKRTPAAAGVSSLLLNVPVYGFLLIYFGDIAFLNRMAITFVLLVITMTVITVIKPLPQPVEMPVRGDIDLKPAPMIKWLGGIVIAITITFYIIFW